MCLERRLVFLVLHITTVVLQVELLVVSEFLLLKNWARTVVLPVELFDVQPLSWEWLPQ